MADFLQKLPAVLILGALVGIFYSLKIRVKSPRVRLWVVAWGFIFIHFFVQLFDASAGPVTGEALQAIELGSLLLAGVFFIVSLSRAVHSRRARWVLVGLLAVPSVAYSSAASFNLQSRAFYFACLLVAYGGGLAFAIQRDRRQTAYLFGLGGLALAVSAWGMYGVLHGDVDAGLNSMLCAGFTAPAILFWRQFPRWSTGVGACVMGFFAWGAVFPAGTLVDALTPNAPVNPELWNVPKFLVAFGMILALLEEKSAAEEKAHWREHELNTQLQSFADLTSRLLSGVDFGVFCGEVAEAITRVTNFERVVILLGDENRRLYVAGHSGLSPEALEHVLTNNARWGVDDIREVCGKGKPLGRSSYLLTLKELENYNPAVSEREFEASESWRHGHEVMIPLLSPRGHHIGCISLDDPKEPERVTGDDMSALELLAADLAVAVENSTLHGQLVRSEKLAAIGQLVAGVAHELNNPLTSVIGYSDLIADDAMSDSSRQRLETLKREAQRMKRIVQNLLRFARQSRPQRKPVHMQEALREVLSLREYSARSQGIELVTDIELDLPAVEADDDQIKHVLINVLGNAMDAVKGAAEKKITIELFAQNGQVCAQFRDNGAGFADLDRALDPFYTTKPVGEGTGLGLSICYGIVKSHGGDIRISNVKPQGACVVVELPAMARQEAQVSAAGASG